MQYKQLFQRMNLDADVRSLQPGEYRKLYNGIPIQPKSSSYANAIQNVITSVLGNALVSYSLPSGTNKCIGYLEDKAGNRGFYFVQNSTASNNSIYQIVGTTITLVFRSAVLDFASTDFIHADIVGDILIWTNGRTETCKIDVIKAIAGTYNSSPLEEITVIKRPPQLPLTRAMVYDNTRTTNFIGEKYFQFYYRYIYENDEYSVLSAASSDRETYGALGIATEVLLAADTNQTLSGLPTIDGVLMTNADTVLLFQQTDKKENGVWSVAAGAWTRSTIADSGTELKDLAVIIQSGLQYRRKTFRNTNSTAITIGVTDITFAITQGPNAIDVTISGSEDIPSTVKTVEHIVRINGTNEYTVYRIENTALVSRTHRFYNDTFFYTLSDSEVTKWNDSVPVKSESLRIQENRLFLFNNQEGYTFLTSQSIAISSLSSGLPVGRYTISHPKMGGRYSVGIVFFDNYARISSALCVTTFEVPEYRLDTGYITSIPAISFDLTGITSIPTWATHYSVVVTEELDRSFFIQTRVTDVYFYKKDLAGVYSYSKTYNVNTNGIAVDIRTLENQGIGYTWSEGDRIKFFTTGTRKTPIDLKIIGQDGSFLFVESSALFTLTTGQSTNQVVEIYTPRINTVQSFYEIGNRYPITNPGVSATLSVTSVAFKGDCFSVNRNMYQTSGAYSDTTPSTNDYEIYGSTGAYMEAMNSFDSNFSNWIRPGGRAIIKNTISDIVSTKEGTIRWSQPYVLESRINGLNVFNALDEYTLPAENGNGIILSERGDNLLALFDTEAVSIYIGEGFVNTTDGNNFLAKTESVIGDDRKLQGSFGTQHPASVVSVSGRTYYLDARSGSVIRASQDGLTIISDYGVRGEISTLCNAHIALGANSRIIGGWDPQYECYVLSFIDTTSTPTGYTYYFHEKSNSWVCLTDLRPEMWGILNQRQIAFTAGALYLQSIEANYNLFFGVQYNRRLEFEISPMQSIEHLWDAIEVDASSIYVTAGTNEDVVLLYHTNGGTLQTRINYLDFQLKAGAYRSSFFRSLNDINFQNTTESKYKSPDQIRGQSAFMVITYNGTDKNVMKSITVFYTPSMNSSP